MPPLWLTLPARIQTGCITSEPRATLPDPTLLREPVAWTTSESGSAGICHTTPGEPCECRPSLGPQAAGWPSWPLECRSQALVRGHLAAVMRWRAPIERPAKGEAVIGWRRGAVGRRRCWQRPRFELKSGRFYLVSPLLPERWRSPAEASALLLANTTQPRHFSLPATVWLRLPQQAQMATQMAIRGGLLISSG